MAKLVTKGMDNRSIATELVLAEGTLKNHISALLRKMNAGNRAALALNLASAFGMFKEERR